MLVLICDGKADAGTGGHLGISRHAVRNGVATLHRKLGVNRRPALIVWARVRGQAARDLAREASHPGRGRRVVERDQAN